MTRMKRFKKMIILVMSLLLFSGCGKVDEVSQKVMNDINELGEITIEDAEQIEKILNIYSTLTDSQKDQVNNYATLLEAQETVEMLIEEANKPTEQDMIVVNAIKMLQKTLIKPDSLELRAVQMSILTYQADYKTELADEKKIYSVKVSYSAMNKAGGYSTDNSIIDYKNGEFDEDIATESQDDGWRQVYSISNASFSEDNKQSILIDYDVEKVNTWLQNY